MKPTRYLLMAAGTMLAVLIAIAGINLLVDPFAMYRLIEINGVNLHKPAVHTRVRLYKAYQIRQIRPTALVLGTSRSHVGLRVFHPGWEPNATPRYNLAFDGATTKEMYLYLRHADSIQPLKQVVLGLDIYQLTDAPAAVRPDFDQEILFDNSSMLSKFRVALAGLRLLISLDTLRASIDTVAGQTDGESEWFAADGQRLGDVFFNRPGEVYREQGPRAYFESIDRQEIRFKVEWRIPSRATPADAAAHPVALETSFDYIRRIVDFCRDRRIDLRIFLTPTHARNLEISAQTGEWPTIERSKKRLADLVGGVYRPSAGVNAPFAGPPAPSGGIVPVPAYDFADFSSITREPLPPRDSRGEMAFYWESSHFKERAGDLVLDRLFGSARPEDPLPDDFGVRLDPATVDREIDATRRRKADYERTHPEDVAEIAAMIREVVAELSPGATPESIGLPVR